MTRKANIGTDNALARAWRWCFAPRASDPVVALREQSLRVLLPMFTLIRVARIYHDYLGDSPKEPALFPFAAVILFFVVPISISFVALVRRRIDLAAYAFLAYWYLTDLISLPREGYWYANFQISLIVQVVLASLLLPRRGIVPFTIFQLVTVISFGAWLDANWYSPPLLGNGEPLTTFLETALTLAVQEIMILVIVRYLRTQMEKHLKLQRAAIVALEEQMSERERAEQAVRESEAKYRNLVENAPLGIVSADLQGRITHVNRSLLEILGSPSAEATREINVLTFAPLIEAGIADQVRRCMELGQVGVSEHSYTTKWTKSAHLRLYLAPIRDTAGSVTGVQGIVEDITERVRAEEKLQENELRYWALFEHNNDAVFIFDLDQVLLAANHRAADMFDYAADEMEGMTVSQLVVPGDYPDRESKLAALMAGKTVPVYERVFRRRDGSVFPGEVNVALARDPQGEPLHFHSIVRDITERKEAEAELKRYHDHLEELVQERTAELKRVVNLMAGREVRMAELKDVIRQLRAQLQEAGLSPVADDAQGARGDEGGRLAPRL